MKWSLFTIVWLSQRQVDSAGGDGGIAQLVVSEIVDEPLNVGGEGRQVLKRD